MCEREGEKERRGGEERSKQRGETWKKKSQDVGNNPQNSVPRVCVCVCVCVCVLLSFSMRTELSLTVVL